MADIQPFRGIHYATASRTDLGRLVSPPYDVIAPAEQDALYERDPHNVIRIVLNRAETGDGPGDGYRRAATALREWLRAGVMLEDDRPSLYVYRQSFVCPRTGLTKERTGFFCALALQPYEAGIVLPHEHTKPGAKADRLALMQATDANVEPIMGLYEDPALAALGALTDGITDGPPELTAVADGQTHEVWTVADPERVSALVRHMADRRIWIADGHHRYETALTYRQSLSAAQAAALPGAGRILIVLIPFEHPGLTVLATHRVLDGLDADAQAGLMASLRERLTIANLPGEPEALEVLARLRSREGAFLIARSEGIALASVAGPEAMAAVAPGASAAWRGLDVSVAQTLVLDRLAQTGVPFNVTYTRDPREALERARSGAVSLLMGEPSAADVRDVTAAGDRMPPKSTFFHPKLWSGLLMRRLDA